MEHNNYTLNNSNKGYVGGNFCENSIIIVGCSVFAGCYALLSVMWIISCNSYKNPIRWDYDYLFDFKK